ncbi:MAG TPA: SLBB domain-containing protein [Vicinamibacteria bacterium]|nr:SLBB domain-containing protein [Vicinamibacteria bacterium]
MLPVLMILVAASPQAPASAPPAPVAAASDPRPAGSAGQDYRIGPGDVLKVTVYGHEDLSQTVVIQPDGSFVFPLLGTIQVVRATPTELAHHLAAMLGKGLIRDPQVSVVVQDFRSQVVFAVGEVTKPGAYPLAGDTTVVEILARAGPLSQNAGSEVVVVRPKGKVDRPLLPNDVGKLDEAEVLRVDMREVRAGHLEKNLKLRANDTVFVPEVSRVFVSGEVRNPGAFPFTPGLTIRQAIALAGGFTADASTKNARVVRSASGGTATMKMKLDEVIRAGDTIVVKAKLF